MSYVLAETLGVVRVLTLNRPDKLNAANLDVQRSLLSQLELAAREEHLRALLLTGAGRAFSAGGDRTVLEGIVAGTSPFREELGRLNSRTMQTLLELRIPVVAAVNGPAIGWGAGLVALCDVVVMAKGSFLSDPHVKYGIAAGPATQLIWPRLCSEVVARELLMTGRAVGADEALRIGLCNRVCADGEEFAMAIEIAELFAGMPAGGIAATKRQLNAAILEGMARTNSAPD